MEKTIFLGFLLMVTILENINSDTYFLTAEVDDLNNSEGTVIFALYNKNGTIPDENFKNYYKIKSGDIIDKTAKVTFNHLNPGIYAITILHDENNNGKIDKKFMLPLPDEGVGFSNYTDFGLNNRPNFKKASFNLNKDTTIVVKTIYK
ncbi:DUF2141 domain-containing protein [Xanthomarina sp. F2636L]|uniref:DUF2141 domain-containing protein n=1 Tax=Xanthomarina sp. F2636L TaxID=2996018 RepID=UPI00225E51A0|nr:DUF2141 domain-containing protein [Xanthomarina sp. F2636L]MCX7549562.1 DUF2141 domain-containing protein [Xanthomarina sp. F2636L]